MLFTGMAGRVGFSGATGENLRNRYSCFGHNGYFVDANGKPSDDYMRQHWVPILTADSVVPAFDGRRRPTLVAYLLEKGATYSGLFKLAIYLSPFLFGAYLHRQAYDARIEADLARISAEAAQVQEQSARRESTATRVQLANDIMAVDPDAAALLALEAFTDERLKNDSRILARARLTLERAIRSSKELGRFTYRGRVTDISFDAGGQLLATSSSDGLALVFDVNTRRLVTKLHHGAAVNRIEFSPDGKLIATASGDKAVNLWDLTAGKVRARLLQDGWTVLDIAFSSDGKLLATAAGRSGDWTTKAYVQLWDVATASERWRSAHDDDVQSIRFTSDSSLLLSRSGKEYSPGTIRVLDAHSGTELSRIAHASYAILSDAVSPDGQIFASGSSDQTARLWDLRTGKELARLLHNSPVRAVKFSPNGRVLVTESGGGAWQSKGAALLWDVATGKLISRLSSSQDISGVAFSGDGHLLATGSMDQTVKIWNVETGAELKTFPHTGPVDRLVFSPDGRIVATASQDNRLQILATAKDISGSEFVAGAVHLWSVTDRLDFEDLKTTGWLSSASFSPSGRLIVTSTGGPTPFQGEARLWDAETAKTVLVLAHGDQVSRAAISPDESLLATTTISGTYIWQTKTGTLLESFSNSGPLSFSPDSRLVASSTGSLAQLRGIASREKLGEVSHQREVRDMAFSRDGSLVATAAGGGGPEGYQGEARLWSAHSAELVSVLKHGNWVCCVAFNPDGSLVATGSNDHYARIWNTKTGKEIYRINHNSDNIKVSFSPNGTILASASENIVLLSDVKTGRLISSLVHDRMKSSVRFRTPSRATRPDGRLYGDVQALVFSPDGSSLATAAGELIRLWDVAAGVELAHYSLDSPGEIQNLSFSPDGGILMAGSEAGTVRRWRVFSTSESLVAFAKERVARCLTRVERAQYSLPPAPPAWCAERNLWPYQSKY
ncbi:MULTISPECIES: WD40 repeat domain-containing protein [unclassified Bradyrhizobium]|uniref:WD40 repeat domain-containing protein n=1 Tax=unclassified Bradyrhizobium TaxID=2631580 RepID=UPI002916C82C|nr:MULTISPECIES: WD40 repeat domain-containing protein [unclassified Bradyrhizobium]